MKSHDGQILFAALLVCAMAIKTTAAQAQDSMPPLVKQRI